MFLDKLSKKERTGLFIAIFFLFLAFQDRLVVNPINSRIQQLNQEIKITEKRLGKDLRNLNQKEIVAREYQKYIQYVKKVGSDEEEVARILEEIEGLARKSGIYLVDMKPQQPKDVDFYKEYVAEIKAESDMESIVVFLHQLNNSPQLLRTERLRLNVKEKESSVISVSMLITKILIP